MTRDFGKRLPHEIPNWVPDGEVFYITINCLHRNRNSLADTPVFEAIHESAKHYETQAHWNIHLMMVMPDHLHGLISFNNGLRGMKETCNFWKRYLTRTQGIVWQKDFFDHRIRSDAEYEEKAHYIRMNPVRAGLCQKPEDCPYTWPK